MSLYISTTQYLSASG
uniref:Uncharacterized protein n=1 Tax=Arundo donax TaxID=35708 RepID=A0A0A9BYH4_ARUDO